MEILCSKKEFANLILDCRESECTKCALEIHCEKAAKKSGDVTKPEGLISICKIKDDSSDLVRAKIGSCQTIQGSDSNTKRK